MADFTSRMARLLGMVRKQMNGAVLDTLRYYGADYGLNYGVAIHTLRDIAREQGKDEGFARYLYRQQVRELRLIGLWLAEPSKTHSEDFDFWAAGIVNSEVAEQAAQALLSKIAEPEALFRKWGSTDNTMLVYSALLAISRSSLLGDMPIFDLLRDILIRFDDNRLVAQGATAVLSALPPHQSAEVKAFVATLPDNPTCRLVREEVAWRVL